MILLILKIMLALIMLASGGVAATEGYQACQAAAQAEVSGPDMLTVFRANKDVAQARLHAREFAAICERSAATLESDCASGDTACLRTGLDFARYRANLVKLTTGGKLYSSFYPTFREVVSGHLDKVAGRNAEKLSPAEHAAWCTAMRQLAASAKYAAENL